MLKKINLGVVFSIFCLFSLASAKTTLSQKFSFYGVEGLVTEMVVNKTSNLRIDLDGEGFSREHLSSAVMETLVKVFQQRKVQYQKIIIAEKGQPDLVLDGDPNPWLRLWKGMSERFFERYHRHLPATMLNNLIAFATGGTLTALAAGPLSLVIGAGFLIYLGKNAADVGVDLYWGRYEQAGAKIFDLVNDLLFAAAGGAWAQKLIAKSSTKFFGLLFRSMRDFAKGPPKEGAPPAKGALIEWDPEGDYPKVKETPKVSPAAPSKPSVRTLPAVSTAPLISNSGLVTLEAIAPNAAATTKGALDSKAHFVPQPIPGEEEPELVYISPALKSFRRWRKELVSVAPQLGVDLAVFEKLLKKDPYAQRLKKITSQEVKALDELMFLLNHGQLSSFPQESASALYNLHVAAHKVVDSAAPQLSNHTQADKTYRDLVEEAVNGAVLLTHAHIMALNWYEEWCRTPEANNARAFCDMVKNYLARIGDAFSKSVNQRPMISRDDLAGTIKDSFSDYLEVNNIDFEDSAMASQVLDPGAAQKIRENYVEFVNSANPQSKHSRFPQGYGGKIMAEYVPELNSVRIFPKGGRNFKNAVAKLVLLHGMGSFNSAAIAYLKVLATVGSNEHGVGVTKSDTRKRLINQFGGEFPVVSMEAIDLMGHGNGPNLLDFPTVDSVVAWLKKYIDLIKSEYDGPIIVVARSASPMFVMELNHRYPGVIDGIFMMSPMYPGFPNETHEYIAHEAWNSINAAGPAIMNKAAFDWIDILAQGSFWTQNMFHTKTPIWINTGADDVEVTDLEKSIYRASDYRYPHVRYKDYGGVGHDIFRATDSKSDAAYPAFERLIKFINSVRAKRMVAPKKRKTR